MIGLVQSHFLISCTILFVFLSASPSFGGENAPCKDYAEAVGLAGQVEVAEPCTNREKLILAKIGDPRMAGGHIPMTTIMSLGGMKNAFTLWEIVYRNLDDVQEPNEFLESLGYFDVSSNYILLEAASRDQTLERFHALSFYFSTERLRLTHKLASMVYSEPLAERISMLEKENHYMLGKCAMNLDAGNIPFATLRRTSIFEDCIR